ncbi:hypothetical protein [Pseudomonas carnis]|uniref:hypothetical protein n=1 Tax=Pseudomonas carnis TaxID=2487355 RepID=UPI001F248BC9|nr:hypothetical protein [Pseudomonas carnis]
MSIKLTSSYPAATAPANLGAVVSQAKPVASNEPIKSEEPQRVALEKAVTDMREFVLASYTHLTLPTTPHEG